MLTTCPWQVRQEEELHRQEARIQSQKQKGLRHGKQITSLVTDLSKVASTVVALTELTESTAESTAESQKRIEAKQAHFEVLLSAVGVGASLKSTKKH